MELHDTSLDSDPLIKTLTTTNLVLLSTEIKFTKYAAKNI